MPNGFHGSLEEWRRMEAPYILVDTILEDFARQYELELQKNYRDADRSLRWSDGVNRSIWIYSMDKYGESGTYRVSVGAYQDKGAQRYVKHGIVANNVEVAELAQALERARAIVASWAENELHPAGAGGEISELL